MSHENRTGEVEFPTAREQIEREIESYMEGMGAGLLEIPSFQLEKGMIRFSFAPRVCPPEMIYEGLGVLTQHIANIRIHTFEPGYVVFQALGENLYDTEAIPHGVKFKFATLGRSNMVEVTRKANLNQDEIEACITLFKFFHPVKMNTNPVGRLQGLGVSVYQTTPEEERKEGVLNLNASDDFIKGYKKTKQEIHESVVLPLLKPELFNEVARLTRGRKTNNIPRAVLFEGPPGVGKTTMARIIARETGIPLIYVSVENILSKFYGESAHNMAAIFDAAQEMDKVIVFLDEIDSLAGSREDGMFEATRRILSVLLRKIDGFEQRQGILTVGATNRSQDLDHALLSRFDQIVSFALPALEERGAIFGGYAKQLTEPDLLTLAQESEGLSGRNIQDICEYAERRWARHLILQKKEASAPNADLYLEVLRARDRSIG